MLLDFGFGFLAPKTVHKRVVDVLQRVRRGRGDVRRDPERFRAQHFREARDSANGVSPNDAA